MKLVRFSFKAAGFSTLPGLEGSISMWNNGHEKKLTCPFLDSYVPRKCSATNRIIKANDHASVQISVGKVDENGRYTGENNTYALCGFIRARGESDDSFNRLAQRDGYLKNVWSASSQR